MPAGVSAAQQREPRPQQAAEQIDGQGDSVGEFTAFLVALFTEVLVALCAWMKKLNPKTANNKVFRITNGHRP